MVYIHGESYEWNSGNPYDGTVLASYGKVVVVTVNFRLGVLGFLKPKATLSNFALLDQTAALHWVKQNIANFGGDPSTVTVFGHGTGAALVNLLLISPVTQASNHGLVRRAILMSGSALSRWAVTDNPHKYTSQMARAMECPPSNFDDALLECLQRKSVQELMSVNFKKKAFYTTIGPIIDNVVIKKKPLKSMQEDTAIFGKFDLLYGVTRAESFHMMNEADVQIGFTVERRNGIVNAYVHNNYENYPRLVMASVTNEYTPWDKTELTDTREVRDLTLDLMSDAQIKAPVMQMADLHSDIHQKSFLYVFNHQSVFGDYPVSHGAIHGEELAYVFGAPLVGGFNHFGMNYTFDEVLLSELVMIYWTNFARTGNPNLPTPQQFKTPRATSRWQTNLKILWPAYEKQQQQYLHIDMEVERKDHYRANYIAVWNKLIPSLLMTSPYSPPPGYPLTPSTSTVFSWTTACGERNRSVTSQRDATLGHISCTSAVLSLLRMSQTKLVLPAPEKNKEPIAQVLKDVIPEKFGADAKLRALEVASGSGQHIVHLAKQFPFITWQPSDLEEKYVESVRAYLGEESLDNVLDPLQIDITKPVSEWPGSFPDGSLDLVLNINMVHISPWECSEALFSAVGKLLRPKGIMVTYGPYSVHGEITPESNVAFNASLKSENPEWGLREVDDLEKEAKKNRMTFDAMFNMPANNKILVWQKMEE